MSNKTSTIEVVTKVNEGCAVLVADEGASRACRSLSFSNIQYSVSVKAAKGEWVAKPILRNVSGSLRGGEMMCVLGPSGSGKTSLVQIVAGGIKSTKSGTHTVCGRILVDGEELTPTAFRRISGFVTQEDVFEGCLTVEETIFFKAALILADMTASERRDRLEAVIAALQLQSCRATYIGDDANPYMKGISGGEKRRLAIAIEILDPSKSVLLADEPTSGLDAASAQVHQFPLSAIEFIHLTYYSLFLPGCGKPAKALCRRGHDRAGISASAAQQHYDSVRLDDGPCAGSGGVLRKCRRLHVLLVQRTDAGGAAAR